jgi:hypothetical protein
VDAGLRNPTLRVQALSDDRDDRTSEHQVAAGCNGKAVVSR